MNYYDVKEIENKYVFNFEDMTREECEFFYKYNKDNKTAAYRERRLKVLLNRIKRLSESDKEINKQRISEIKLAEEYAEMTFNWEDIGAKWKMEGHKGYFEEVVWRYKGTEFFRWGGNTIKDRHISQHLEKAKVANEKLNKMLEE